MDILAEPFFQRALLGGLLVGLMAPLLGMFLVLRRLSMIGDALSHVSIAGVALGLLAGAYPLAVGLLFAVAASFAIEKLRKAYRTYAELPIAIITSGGVALATFLFTLGRGFNLNAQSYLFGSVYTLSGTDLWTILIVTAIVTSFVIVARKEMFLVTFDEDAAHVTGLPVRKLNLAVTVLTALVIGVAIKIVGALLVSALLTAPVAISLVLGRSFRHSLAVAVVVSETAVLAGLLAAGVWNFAPGATVVLSLVLILLGALAMRRTIKV